MVASDLFAATIRFERIPMPDADVSYLAHIELPRSDTEILRRLIVEVPWRQEEILIWGRRMPQPRLVAWYGDPGRNYAYSGIQLHPLPWTAGLLDMKQRIEATAGATFNSVLLNYYRNNNDSMGFHSDDEPELGERPIIASLSLGEERTFVLKHKNKSIRPVRLRLPSGSLLVMRGETQRFWKHGIAKEARRSGPRINLTFRRIIQQQG